MSGLARRYATLQKRQYPRLPDISGDAVAKAVRAAVRRLHPALRGIAFEMEVTWALKETLVSDSNRILWKTSFPQLLVALSEAQNHRCCWCGGAMVLDRSRSADQATFEHVVQLWRGGADHPDNLAVAHYGCNAGREPPVTYSKFLGVG